MQKPTFRKRKLLYTPIGIAVLFLAFVYVSYSTIGLYGKYKEAMAKNKVAASALADARDREYKIQTESDKLATDRGQEEIIREKFDVVKGGEGVVVIPDDSLGQSASADSAVSAEHKGFWDFLKNIFK